MQTAEEKRRYNKERYIKNREKLMEKSRKYAVNNKDRVRNNYLQRNYGITKDTYDAMREAQGRRCAICGKEESSLGYELRVDHEHILGYDDMKPQKKKQYVRGLLCDLCNLGVSYFGDSPDRLEVAKQYLITRK